MYRKWRYKLAFWYDWKRTLLTISIGLLIFTAWDLAAISLGIFIHGESRYSLPFTLLPEFPVEEIAFLFLLCYCTLALYRGAHTLWPRI